MSPYWKVRFWLTENRRAGDESLDLEIARSMPGERHAFRPRVYSATGLHGLKLNAGLAGRGSYALVTVYYRAADMLGTSMDQVLHPGVGLRENIQNLPLSLATSELLGKL